MKNQSAGHGRPRSLISTIVDSVGTLLFALTFCIIGLTSKNTASLPLIPENQKPCRQCAQPIPRRAKKCHHCEEYQSRFWSNVSHSNLLISLLVVGITIWQLSLARQQTTAAISQANAAEQQLTFAREERTKAQEALERAENALKLADNVNSLMIKAQVELTTFQNTSQDAISTLQSIIEVNLLFIRANNDDRKAVDELIRIAKSPEHKFRDDAHLAAVNLGSIPRVVLKISWEPGVNPQNLSYTRH